MSRCIQGRELLADWMGSVVVVHRLAHGAAPSVPQGVRCGGPRSIFACCQMDAVLSGERELLRAFRAVRWMCA